MAVRCITWIPRFRTNGRRSWAPRTRLTATVKSRTSPRRCRSSGMWPAPALRISPGDRLTTAVPLRSTRPSSARRSPVSTSTSSACPLPSTPATPRISPSRTSKETPRSTGTPLSLAARRSLTASTTGPGSAGPRWTRSNTFRPTMRVAMSPREVSAVAMHPTTRPPRMTVTRSETAMTSLSLWVMKTMVLPRALRERRMSNSSAASPGARTAVGSSRIRISAPRYSTLRISMRCSMPTLRSSTRAAGPP